MAARLRKTHQDEMRTKWPFYVYELAKDGQSQYIGKGSGRRLAAQIRNFGIEGVEIARFKREKDAYAFEVKAIAERAPILNRHKGGNGSHAQIKRERRPKWDIEIERIGSRAYAARLVLAYGLSLIDKSKVDAIRRVAYG